MEQNVAYHREGGLSFLHCNATSGGKRPEACAGHSRYLARPVKCRFTACEDLPDSDNPGAAVYCDDAYDGRASGERSGRRGCRP